MIAGGKQGECAPKLSLSGSVCVPADESWGGQGECASKLSLSGSVCTSADSRVEGDVLVGVQPEGAFLAVTGTKIFARLDLFKKLGMIWKDRSNSASIIRENTRDNPVRNPRDSWNRKSASALLHAIHSHLYQRIPSYRQKKDNKWVKKGGGV